MKRADCQRCETLPDPMPSQGRLHMRLPLTHSLGKVLARLKRAAWDFTEDEGVISIETSQLVPVTSAVREVLTPIEQNDVQVLFEPAGKTLRLADYLSTCSLDQFSARLESDWMVSLLREGRLKTVFQPLVHSNAPDTVFAYECLMRGVGDQGLIAPGRLLEVARGAGLIFQVDLAARKAAISAAAQHGIQQKLFVNFTPTAIYDPIFCLKSTMSLIDDLGLSRGQVVFEVVESAHVADVRHLGRILDYYRDAGFQVALDDLGSGYSSLNLLHQLRPDYVKLDMDLIRGVHLDRYRGIMVRKLIEAAHELGLKVVAEGVEEVGEFYWLQAHQVDYQQGYLFARPGLPPPIPNPVPAPEPMTLAV